MPSLLANWRMRSNVWGSASPYSLGSAAMISTSASATRAVEPTAASASFESSRTRARLMSVSSSSATPMTDMGWPMCAKPASSPAWVLLLPVQCTM